MYEVSQRACRILANDGKSRGLFVTLLLLLCKTTRC